ncbi:phenylalanine--tRNA ligase subunit beta, partial [Patescibacteria group bacterium]|nr:phenylalanine--tRNA ligase subunit beta [Patescibacteria group bacterium]
MRFSYKWLKELVDFKETPQELADLINLHITEVETVNNKSADYSGVIVAEILAIEPHPDADKLRLPLLDIGLGKRVQVVCGASNIEIGQKVPLALVGAVLPAGKIEKTTIRGVESSGMICSAAELGLEEKSEGILVLSKTASVGRPANEFLQLSDDTILDLKVLSNRPDYLSYIGMAREISAVLSKDWTLPIKLEFTSDTTKPIRHQIEVVVKDSDLCPYYLASYASNLEVKESPDWLKDKLVSAGIRPINNLVDISNLVMLEIGQPVHIFDAKKIESKRVVVRRANPEETLLTLAGESKELTRDILVIADSHRPVALAGIMGGEESAVNDLTTEVVIESAVFNPSIIRRGSKLLGISTDASLRFERGSNPYLAKLASDRTIALIQLIIPEATIAEGLVSIGKGEQIKSTIVVSEKEISALLGI